MNNWLRLWHDMPNDPKWRTISRASQSSISEVIAVYMHLLVQGSTNATERGRTQPNTEEDIASALDLERDVVVRIREAMQGRVLDGDKLMGWEARQPKREDGSAERSKAWREKQKGNTDRTQPNATERNRTQDESRETTSSKKEIYRPSGDYWTLSEWLRANDRTSLPDEWITVARLTASKCGKDPSRVPKQLERFVTFHTVGKGSDYTSNDWASKAFTWVKDDKYGGKPA